MNDPTLPEIRELLDDVYHEIDNHRGPDSPDGNLFFRAHETLRWLLDEYLRRGTHVVSE